VDENEVCELLTAPGFFGFVAKQVELIPEEVERIYLLGRPWGLWPPDLDVAREAGEAGVGLFTYLAALQPLIDMDTQEKEAQLAAYHGTLTGSKVTQATRPVGAYVEKVAALSGKDKETICRILHALYAYRQRVGQLSIQKVRELSTQKVAQDKAASIAKLQRVMVAEIEQRKANGGDQWN
jgi:hypothetical protein